MYNLSYDQAVEMMQQGKRVKHQYFTGDEWFEMKGNRVIDEEGYPMAGWYRGETWQNTGWMVLDWTPQEVERPRDVQIVDDLSSLELRALSVMAADSVIDFYAVPEIKQHDTKPISHRQYQFKIVKGRGHNKLQKRKKK